MRETEPGSFQHRVPTLLLTLQYAPPFSRPADTVAVTLYFPTSFSCFQFSGLTEPYHISVLTVSFWPGYCPCSSGLVSLPINFPHPGKLWLTLWCFPYPDKLWLLGEAFPDSLVHVTLLSASTAPCSSPEADGIYCLPSADLSIWPVLSQSLQQPWEGTEEKPEARMVKQLKSDSQQVGRIQDSGFWANALCSHVLISGLFWTVLWYFSSNDWLI